MERIAVTITNIVDHTPEIKGYTLQSTDGTALPAYIAGAHIDVHINSHYTRQYSLCHPYRQGEHYKIAVLKDLNSRGGSVAMHQDFSVGDTLYISPPKNLFGITGNANHHVLIAGGIGITPILCMAEQLHQQGASFELHYCSKSSEHMAFQHYLLNTPYRSNIHLYHDNQQHIDIQNILKTFHP